MTRVCWIGAVVIVLGTLAASTVVYPRLPDRVPIHWNIKGEIDGYSGKSFGAFFMPGVMVAMLGLMALLQKITPRAWPIETFKATYAYITLLVTGLFAYLHGLAMMAAMGRSPDFPRAMMGGLCLFFALIGNVLGRVTRNPWVGIRVPWTLASDRVWNATHRLGAWLFVGMGIVGLILVAVHAPWWSAFIPIAIACVVPIVYSYLLDRKLGEGERS